MHQRCISQRRQNYFPTTRNNSFSTSNWSLWLRSQPYFPSTPCILAVLWSNILPGSNPPTAGSTLLVSLADHQDMWQCPQQAAGDIYWPHIHGRPRHCTQCRCFKEGSIYSSDLRKFRGQLVWKGSGKSSLHVLWGSVPLAQALAPVWETECCF